MEAIAAAAGNAALSAAFDAIFGKLSSQDVLKYARRNNVEFEVNQWNKFLHKMKYVLDEAEERQMSEGLIKFWLDDLRDLAYDVEDILDEFSTEVLLQKVMAETEAPTSKVRKLINTTCACLSPRDIKFNVSLGLKMKETTQRFERITKEKEDLRLTERVTGGSSGVVRERLETTSLVQESHVYGQKKDKETLINELLSSDANGKPVSVVAIVGMGGLGKTTLAQLVYNDETVSKSFDIKAWVCVSDEFDVFKITVKIADRFTSSPGDEKDLNSVQEKLKDVLRKKKFLLILDNVWNENYLQWDALSQPLAAGGLGSKVLITTRNENVAATAGAVFMHRLKKLEPKECLSLFLHALGENDFSRHPSLQEIGEKIVEKCDGLPLAAKALGGLLRGKSNPREWRTVLNSNTWELPQDKCPILPALRVSYLYLPSHLKRCFAYCAIFPKDYEFKKDDLILWWMAQGFLEQSKNVGSNFMEVGNEYFNDLLSRSFFQPSASDDDSKFVMHDLLNDLAIWISEGICLHLLHNEETNDNIEFEKLYYLSFLPQECEFAKRFQKFSSSMKLRSFIAFDIRAWYGGHRLSNVILNEVIVKMKYLKLLCLSDYNIKKLPHSISDMKQLRHLDISHTRIRLLPESISDLLNLQVLKLYECYSLIQLPRDIRNLVNLRLLNVSKTDNLKVMSAGIGRLMNLQILTKFIVGENHGLRLMELQGLPLIGGELSIWGLEKVVDIQDVRDANLKAKKNLVSLEFKWMERTSALEEEKQVQILDELQPHSSLKSLQVHGYNGNRFPNWIGYSCVTNLETLYLLDSRSASLLPPLGGMSSLKMLKISGMHEVKKMGKEFLGNTSNSFPSLHTLILESMNALEEWCSVFGFGEEAGVEFPQLQKLFIWDCPMLAGKIPNHLPLLEELNIRGCPMLAGLPNQLPLLGNLSICRCPILASLPNQLPSLEKLSIDGCHMLTGKLPNQLPLLGEWHIRKCPNLTNLECIHPSLKKLIVQDCSESTLKILANLNSLVRLELKNIKELNYMDDGLVSMLGELQEMEIERCRELKTLVRNGQGIEGMVGLKTLTITCCDELEALVATGETGLNYLPSLESLYISGCDKLVSFGAMWLPFSLKKMDISNCPALKSLPDGFMIDLINTNKSALEQLDISYCPSLTTFPRGVFPYQLARLTIQGGQNLESMPTSLDRENVQYRSRLLECIGISNAEEMKPGAEKMFADCFYSLEYLVIKGFNLRRLSENTTTFRKMTNLEIENCENLREFPKQIQELTCLQRLTINKCPNLELLGGQDLPRQLKILYIAKCEKVIEGLFDGGLSSLTSLTYLCIDGVGVNKKQEVPIFLPKLHFLSMSNLGNLESLAAAFQFPSTFEAICIDNCPKLRELPIHGLSSSLGCLYIYNCPLLEKRCLHRKGEYWPKLSNIPKFTINMKTPL